MSVDQIEADPIRFFLHMEVYASIVSTYSVILD